MALINCPKCNKQISDKATICPNCGCSVTEARNKIKYEKEIEAKEKISSLVIEQDNNISQLESAAEEEIQSLIENQKKTISKLEKDIANRNKRKSYNSGKYLLCGILCCIFLIGGYYLFSKNEKTEFDSSGGLQKPIDRLNGNESTNISRDEQMELEAINNAQKFDSAITSTGVVLDFNYKNDSVRLFIQAMDMPREQGKFYDTKFMAYFFKHKNPKEFFFCKFTEVESPEFEQYADFVIYDSNNNFYGDLSVGLELWRVDEAISTEGPEVTIIRNNNDIESHQSIRIQSISKQENTSITSTNETFDPINKDIARYDILEIDNCTPFNIVKWKTDFIADGDFWFSEKGNLTTDEMWWGDGTSSDLGHFTFHRFNGSQYTCTFLRDSNSIGVDDDGYGGRVRYNIAVRDESRNTLEMTDGYYVLDLRTWQGYVPLYLPYSKKYISECFSQGDILFEYIQ